MPYLQGHVSCKFGTNPSIPDFSPNTDVEHRLPFYQYTCTAIFLIIRILLFSKWMINWEDFCISEKQERILKHQIFSRCFKDGLISKQGRFVYHAKCYFKVSPIWKYCCCFHIVYFKLVILSFKISKRSQDIWVVH